MDLLARLQWILDHRKLGQRELSRRAELDQRHLGVIMGRLRKNPDAALEHETIAALARAGGVSLVWLSTGKGAPESSVVSRVEYDDRYANRAAVIELLAGDVAPIAVERLRGYAFHGDDPSRAEWTKWLLEEDSRARREAVPPPVPTPKKKGRARG